jgi:predicted metalloprotease with PDZ domain
MAKENEEIFQSPSVNEKSNCDYFYSVNVFDIHQHYFEISLVLQSNKPELILCLPAWTPGSYMIRDYSTHLHQFSARDKESGQELLWEQIGLHRWKIKTNGNSVQIRYIIYAFEDFTVRTNYLVKEFGFINPPAMFLYEEDCLIKPVTLHMNVSIQFSNVYTSLPRINDQYSFYAKDFDELYDSPFHLSNSNSIFFDSESCKHELIVEGNVPYSFKERLSEDLQKITSKQIQMMDGSPNKYYLFVLNLTQSAYGGLEHRASSVNFFSPELIFEEDEYKKLLELLSHEYFHLWNIKRIRPLALGPFDYQNPNLTRELWIAEGITSFYDVYFLYLTGFLTKDEFLNRLQNDIFSLEETDSETWMSLEDSSFTAWNKFYKRNANSHNTSVSYYTKGAVLVLCMVLYLLKMTNGEKSFLDIMKALLRKFHMEKDRGFTKQEFFETAKETTGVDLKIEFDHLLTKPVALPVDDYLKIIGVYRFESDLSADIKFKVREKNGNLFINRIFLNRALPSVDIQLDDEIIALNGKRMNKTGFERFEKQIKPKEHVHILLARFGQIKEVMLEAGSAFKTKKMIFIADIGEGEKRLQDLFFSRT